VSRTAPGAVFRREGGSDPLREARVIVTGGAGFIGSHVVDQLVSAGSRVVVIDDFSTGSRANLGRHSQGDLSVVEGDIRDLDAMIDLIRDADLVLHMAAASLRLSLSDPALVHEINATGTLNVCRAAYENEVGRLVYVSSSEAYGSAKYVPMDEEHPLDPTTVYGASKAAGELYALACHHTYGLETIVIRPFNTYGPREHAEGTSAEVIPKFVMRALAGLPPVIFGSGSQTRDFTWAEETAQGIVLASQCDALVGERVNIARGQEVRITTICDLVLKAVQRDDLEPARASDRPGDVMRHYADVTKAADVLGFSAKVDIAAGIERYVNWVRDQNLDAGAWARRETVRNW